MSAAATPSQYAALEVDASRKEGPAPTTPDAAAAAAATAAAAADDDDGPEFCCPGGVYINNPSGNSFRIFCEWIGIPLLLWIGPAYGIYASDKDRFDANIARLFPDATDGLWVALTVYAFLTTMAWVNVQPTKYKARIFGWEMRDDIWANPVLLRTIPHQQYNPNKRRRLVKLRKPDTAAGDLEAQQAETQTTPAPLLVGFETQGEVGKLNRGTRSLHHMCENAFPVYILAVYLSRIFPVPMFVLGVIWCVGRIGHQYNYAERGYGVKKHLPYFIAANYSQHVMHCLVLIVVLRCAEVL